MERGDRPPGEDSEKKTRVVARSRALGFSLVETLVALALTGMLLSALATVTGQWLPSWRHGFQGMQRFEVAGRRDRAPRRRHRRGKSRHRKQDVRAAVVHRRPKRDCLRSPGDRAQCRRGLEWVRVAEQEGGLARARAPYTPAADAPPRPPSSTPLSLRLVLSFPLSYAGPTICGRRRLGRPGDTAVGGADRRLRRRRNRPPPLSTTVALRVDAPTSCAGQTSIETASAAFPGAMTDGRDERQRLRSCRDALAARGARHARVDLVGLHARRRGRRILARGIAEDRSRRAIGRRAYSAAPRQLHTRPGAAARRLPVCAARRADRCRVRLRKGARRPQRRAESDAGRTVRFPRGGRR